nr:5423_t:CDS:2 [Entrophospora candida]
MNALKDTTVTGRRIKNKVVFEVIEKLEQSAKDLAEAINTAEA